MNPRKQMPHLRFIALCEKVTINADNTPNILGVIRGKVVTSEVEAFPAVPLEMMIAIAILGTEQTLTYQLTCSLTPPNGRERELGSDEIGLVDGRFIELHYAPLLIQVSEFGLYWVNVYLDGELFGRTPFVVIHQSPAIH